MSTIAGDGYITCRDGTGKTASFSKPVAIVGCAENDPFITTTESFLIADCDSDAIRKLTIKRSWTGQTVTVSTLSLVSSAGQPASIVKPTDLCVDPWCTTRSGYFVSTSTNLYRLDTDSSVLSPLVGAGGDAASEGVIRSCTGLCAPNSAAADWRSLVVVDCGKACVRAVDPRTGSVTALIGDSLSLVRDGIGLDTSFSRPQRAAFDRTPENADRVLYITDTHSIRVYDMKSGALSTVRIPTSPDGIVARENGLLFVSCPATNLIYWVDPSIRSSGTVAGGGGDGIKPVNGAALQASFNEPAGLALTNRDRTLFVVDSGHCIIRCVSL